MASPASKSIKLYSEELIDPEIEFHYAFHKSFGDITIVHTHNFYELFIILKGEVLHCVNTETHLLSEGALVFIRPQDIHWYQPSNGAECHLINLAFRESTVRELFSYLGRGFHWEEMLERPFPPGIVLSPGERDILYAKLQRLNTIPRDQKPRIRSALRILLFEIFTNYFAYERGSGKEGIPDWFGSLLHELQKKENFVGGIENVYTLSGRSPEHISRVFRKYLKTTPTEYINDLRLHYAANMLSTTDENVTFISLEAGFENLSHFYHLFGKKFHMSPVRFRERTRKVAIPM